MEAFYTLDQLVPCYFPLGPHCCYNWGLFLRDMLQHIVLFPTVVSIDFFIQLHVLHIMNLILAAYVHGWLLEWKGTILWANICAWFIIRLCGLLINILSWRSFLLIAYKLHSSSRLNNNNNWRGASWWLLTTTMLSNFLCKAFEWSMDPKFDCFRPLASMLWTQWHQFTNELEISPFSKVHVALIVSWIMIYIFILGFKGKP